MNIVSLAPSNTEILYAIGAGSEVVATTSLCDYPPEATEKPSIGGWSSGLDIDKVVNMDPDVALASDDLQDAVVEKLRSRSVKVVQVSPHTLEQVFESMIEIGDSVNRTEEAEKLARKMKSSLDKISVPETRIYCEEWMEPPMASGNWVPGLVDKIGGEYFLEEGERSHEFGLNKLQEFDPEHIFLNVCGAGKNIDTGKLKQRNGWQQITAVKEDNIHVIDDALLNRPGPRLVEGAKRIADHVS